jgi:hypothetical protein
MSFEQNTIWKEEYTYIMELKEICYRVRGCIKPCDDGG